MPQFRWASPYSSVDTSFAFFDKLLVTADNQSESYILSAGSVVLLKYDDSNRQVGVIVEFFERKLDFNKYARVQWLFPLSSIEVRT